MGKSSDKNDEFVKAYKEYADAIFRYSFFRLSSRELAKDLTQEVFTKTWYYLSQDKVIDNFKAFLFKVANNLIIDEYRKYRPSSLDQLQEEGFDPESKESEQIVFSTEVAHIRKVINALDDKYRDVVIMRYINDLSPQEIASITGETENVISVRLNRAVKKIRELLKS